MLFFFGDQKEKYLTFYFVMTIAFFFQDYIVQILSLTSNTFLTPKTPLLSKSLPLFSQRFHEK